MVLENKLHLTDSVELARVEEKISKKKAIELFGSEVAPKVRAYFENK